MELNKLSRATHYGDVESWRERINNLAKRNHEFTIAYNGGNISLLDLLNHPEIFETPGRITIYAKNSAGKSTLLLAISSYFDPTDVFVLPAHNKLHFRGPAGDVNSNKRKSFGEMKSQQFKEIDTRVDSFILALDEWNAFLDNKNHTRLDRMVDCWSKSRCVVETLNRRLPMPKNS